MKNHRYLARILIEAKTPFFAGAGESSLLNDAIVQKDHNGLPMISGTSLMGVLRHTLLSTNDASKDKWNQVFGFQSGNEGLGSRFSISNAYILTANQKIEEGYLDSTSQAAIFFNNELPVRQHVKITDRGVAKERSLFNNEIVHAGARFIFEMEFIGNDEDRILWEQILQNFIHPLYRIGAGTRKGYGKMKVAGVWDCCYDLTKSDDLEAYMKLDPSLNSIQVPETNISPVDSDCTEYRLILTPDDFFIFGAGHGDEEADVVQVMESVISYTQEGFDLKEKIVIPASSIKGALAHRTCFHYNKLKNIFSDSGYKTGVTDEKNIAVNELFGKKDGREDEKNDAKTNSESEIGQTGRVIIDDIFIDPELTTAQMFQHVAIDRFTGGAMDGALFGEKAVTPWNSKDFLTIPVILENKKFSPAVVEAFENALLDITMGLLPLGGMTTKGYGMFSGVLTKNETKIEQHHTSFMPEIYEGLNPDVTR